MSQQLKEPPVWESLQWQTAVSQIPGLAPFFDNLESFVELPEGVEKLRGLFLDLAVRGKLVPQDPSDEHACELIQSIQEERSRLVKSKQIGKPRKVTPAAPCNWDGTIPQNWTLSHLGDVVFDFQNGLSKRRSTVGDPTPVLRLADIDNGEISKAELREIQLTEKEIAKYPLVEGDLLIIRVNGSADLVGRFIPCRETARWTFCDHFIRVNVPAQFLDTTYLCIIANSAWGRSHVDQNTVTTAGQKTINQTGVGTMPLLIPPLAEQRRIVSKVEGLISLCDTLESQRVARKSVRAGASCSVLASLSSAPLRRSSSTDTLGSAWQRLSDHFEVLLDQPTSVDSLRQSILQLAVQGKLVPQDPNDEPANIAVSEILRKREELIKSKITKRPRGETELTDKDTPFELPSGWAWIKLGRILEKMGAGSTPLGGKKGYVDEGVKFLRSQNIYNDGLRLNGVARIPEHVHEKMSGTHVRAGDVLLNITGASIGRSALVPDDFDTANVSQHVAILRLIDQRLRRFLQLCIVSPFFQETIMRVQVGVSREGLSMTRLREFPFPVPPVAEQKRIVSKVSVLLSQLDELSTEMRSRQSTTDALLTALIHQILAVKP